MRRSLRPIASILVLAATLLGLAAPVTAAPRAEAFSESPAPGLRLFAEMWTWASAWIVELPIESVWAPGGASMDPNGEPATAGGPVPGPSDTERGREDSTNTGT